MSRGDSYMEAARDVMDKMNQDRVERYLYLRREMAYTDEISRIRTAENLGMKQGMEKGIEKGMEKGIRESIFALLAELGEIPADLNTYINEESDLEVLKDWLKKAAKAMSMEQFREAIRQSL